MKDVLITGAGGGMGNAALKLMRDKGYRVFALDKRSVDEEENVIPIEADVTSEESMLSAFEKVKEKTDSLYAIIHFAGIYMLDSLLEIDSNDFKRIFDVNLCGAFLVNKTFMPLLTLESRILIITSELATIDPLPFTGIYAITKAALDRYAYSLRMELQLLGISVSVLRAGAVDTGMIAVSTDALDKFIEKTKLYSCNAERFKGIVNKVEARSISSEKLARKAISIIEKRRPKFAYSINRNKLLCLYGALPNFLQLFAIQKILKK